MKTIIYVLISFLFIFIFLPSCGGDLTSAQEVIKLQVLSIKSDKPEVHPGDTVISKVLIGKPENDATEYHSVWFLCDPKSDGSSGTAFAECMNPKAGNLIGLPTIDKDEYSIKVPDDVLSINNLKSKYMYVLYILCESDMETCQNAMTSSEGSKEMGFSSDIFKLTLKRIRVISPETEITNHNPQIEGIYLNNELVNTDSITLDNNDNVFKVKISQDSYDKKTNPDGELINETIATAWKSNSGKFDYYYTNQEKEESLDDLDENPFTTPKDKTDAYKIYIIATDTRGGIDWKVLNVVSSK